MAGKKISELTEVTSITDADELVFVDKEGTGSESGAGGKTARITFANLKTSLGTSGQKGEPGMDGSKGEPGNQGEPGEGADSYWTTGSVADTIGYAGKVGIGTTEPDGPLHVVGNSVFTDPSGVGSRVVIGHPSIGGDIVSANIRIFDSNGEQQMELLGGGHYLFMNGNVGIGTTAPGSPLHVHNKGAATVARFARSTDNGGGSNYLLAITELEDNNARLDMQNAGGLSKVRIETAGNTFFNGGNVGIGTNTPEAPLSISKHHTDSADGIDNLIVLAATEKPGQDLVRDDGVGILFKVPVSDNTQAIGARIAGVREGTTDSNSSTDLVFQVSNNDETLDTVMRITRDGDVQIQSGLPTDPSRATLKIRANNDAENALAMWVVNKAHTASIITAREDGDVQIGGVYFNAHSRGKGGDTRTNADFVGIGTLEPTQELHISGLGRVKATSEDGLAWSYYSTENATNNKMWQFGQLIGDRADYADQFFIIPQHQDADGNTFADLDWGLYITNDSETPSNSGRVGIGRRENIMTKLDVLGASRVSGELLVPEGEGNNVTGGMLKTLNVEGTRSAYRGVYYISDKSSQKRYFLNIILPGADIYQQFKINVATHRRSIDSNTTHWMKYGYFEDKGYACGESDWEKLFIFHEDGLGNSNAQLTGVGNAFTAITRNSFFIHKKDTANLDGADLDDLGFTKLSGNSKVFDSAGNQIYMSAKIISYELTLPHDGHAETGSQIPLVVNVELLDNSYSIRPHNIPVAKIVEVAV